MAKDAKASEAVEKPKKPKIDPAVIDKVKAELREALNGLEPVALDKTAKRFGVEVAKYAKLPPALKKMSTVNACLGSAARWIREDGKTKKDVFSLIAK